MTLKYKFWSRKVGANYDGEFGSGKLIQNQQKRFHYRIFATSRIITIQKIEFPLNIKDFVDYYLVAALVFYTYEK